MKKLFLALLFVPATAFSSQLINFHNNVSIGEGTLYQHYQEHIKGQTFDQESGWLSTFDGSASYMSPRNHIFIEGNIRYTKGNDSYTSRYIVSHTGNNVVDGSLKLGKGFQINSQLLVTPFITYGHRYWNRKLSYTENYNMNFAGAGIEADYQVTPNLIVSGQGMGGSTFDNSLNTPGTRVTYNLGNEPIVQASLSANYRLLKNWYAFSRINYNYYRFGQSKVNARYQTFEPNSTTQEASIDFGIRYTY